MPEINPLAVIAECIEKAKAITDQELINDYIAEALGVLQIDNTEGWLSNVGQCHRRRSRRRRGAFRQFVRGLDRVGGVAKAVATDYRWCVSLPH